MNNMVVRLIFDIYVRLMTKCRPKLFCVFYSCFFKKRKNLHEVAFRIIIKLQFSRHMNVRNQRFVCRPKFQILQHFPPSKQVKICCRTFLQR